MSENDNARINDRYSRVPTEGACDSVANQCAELLMSPSEHNSHSKTSAALDAIEKANQILPYIDMTQAFMENPDPSYERKQTFSLNKSNHREPDYAGASPRSASEKRNR